MAEQRNIALTTQANRITDDLLERFKLNERRDAARLGFAYALRHGVEPTRDEGWAPTDGTNFNVSTVDDEEASLRKLVSVYHPDHALEAYRTVETLMNKGLVLLAEHIQAGEVSDLRDLVGEVSDQPPA